MRQNRRNSRQPNGAPKRRRVAQSPATNRSRGWNFLLLTAANPAQARLYQKHLDRRSIGRARALVIADPPGPRIGSGGATLRALAQLKKQYALSDPAFAGKRILLIHSGGMSQRLPMYAAVGKLLMPVDADGSLLLDQVLGILGPLGKRLPPGILTASGDVLLDIETQSVAVADCPVTALALREPPKIATQHGVFVTDQHGFVTATLQKATIPQLSKANAIDPNGRVLLDTGLFFFDKIGTKQLLAFPSRKPLDLYSEIIPTIAQSAPGALRVVELTGRFIHLGTAPQFQTHLAPDRPLIIDSILPKDARIGRGTIVDASMLAGPVKIGNRCIITNVHTHTGLTIPDNTLSFGIPLKSGWIHINCPIGTDFKKSWSTSLFQVTPDPAATPKSMSLSDIFQQIDPSTADNRRTWLRSLSRPHTHWLPALQSAAELHRLGHHDHAFHRVATATELGQPTRARITRATKPIKINQTITAQAPARLDLAGGWSDTPPYCYEQGGQVTNLAINLNGQPPIIATITRTRRPGIELISHDQQIRAHIRDLPASLDHTDALALHKAALHQSGMKPGKSGWKITTNARVPKGSGLGTSSILAAALLAAIYRAQGAALSKSQLVQQTLLLEQRLGTGGGWQDQIGGIFPGAKSSRSKPGIPQQPTVSPIPLSPKALDELESRLVVFFTGRQRLARNILRQVMSRWLSREPQAVRILKNLPINAQRAAAAIKSRNFPSLANQINQYWTAKRQLDRGSSTPQIDRLLAKIQARSTAVSLAGAGGGGFGYALCKSAAQAESLREFLNKQLKPHQGAVFPATINRTGLELSLKASETPHP